MSQSMPPRYRAFLSHNSSDKPLVEELARRLEKDGIRCFLDKWHLIPGQPWQPALEDALQNSASCVVFIGPSGLGPWQSEEMRAAIVRRVTESAGKFPVVPVLLPGAKRDKRTRLPAFLVAVTWVEFRQSLDERDNYHRLVSGIHGKAPGPPSGEALYEGQCPYRGLQVFDQDYASFFFGRDAQVDWMLDKLSQNFGTPHEVRFLAVVGASGSGKSSLVRSGLIPAIRRGESRSGKGLPGSRDWPVVILRPGFDPLNNLATALGTEPTVKVEAGDVLEFAGKLRKNARRLGATIDTALHRSPVSRRLLLVVDQFEEVFSLCPDEMEGDRQAFIHNLLHASSVVDGKTVVVLTMRADFYGKCAHYQQLAHAVGDDQELVPALCEPELRRAIEEPARLCGLELEPGLTELLLHEMRGQPAGSLPLLQQTMLMLWQRRDGRRLTVAAYKKIGELEGALDHHADEMFNAFSSEEQNICRRLFLRLTQPGQGTEDTKRHVARRELEQSEIGHRVIQKLADARLITIEKEREGHKTVSVEISHEALIRGWSRLRGWLDADREMLLTHHRLIQATKDWDEGGRRSRDLLGGNRLNNAIELRVKKDEWLSAVEKYFLRQSVRLANWLQGLKWLTVAALLSLTTTTAVLQWKYNHALIGKLSAEFDRRDAYDAYMTTFATVLKGVPGGLVAREQVYEKVATAYENSAKESKTNLSLQLEFGRTILRLGDARTALGDLAGAEKAFRRAKRHFGLQLKNNLVRPPFTRDYRLELAHSSTRLANVLYAQNVDLVVADQEYQYAITELQKLKRLDDGEVDVREAFADALLNRAQLAQTQGRLTKTEQLAQAANKEFAFVSQFKSSRGRIRAGNVLARILALMGRPTEAAAQLTNALTYADQLVDKNPTDMELLSLRADSRLYHATILHKLGRYTEERSTREAAAGDYLRVKNHDEMNPRYLQGYAFAALNLGKFLREGGHTVAARNQLQEAKESLEKLVTIHSTGSQHKEALAVCYDVLGQSFYDLGENGEARRLITHAVEIFQQLVADLSTLPDEQPQLSVYLRRLAVSRGHLGLALQELKDYPAAKREFSKAISQLKDCARSNSPDLRWRAMDNVAHVQMNLGILLWNQRELESSRQEFSNAKETWRDLIEEAPQAPYLNRFARFLAYYSDLHKYDVDDAIELASRAVNDAPVNPDHYHVLGVAHYRLNNWAESTKQLLRAIEIRGQGNGLDWLFLAMAQWRQGNSKDAFNTRDLVIEWIQTNQPDHPEWRRIRNEAEEVGLTLD